MEPRAGEGEPASDGVAGGEDIVFQSPPPAFTFNGTPAAFRASNSAITTTYPTGATTGYVQVVTPHGTLSCG